MFSSSIKLIYKSILHLNSEKQFSIAFKRINIYHTYKRRLGREMLIRGTDNNNIAYDYSLLHIYAMLSIPYIYIFRWCWYHWWYCNKKWLNLEILLGDLALLFFSYSTLLFEEPIFFFFFFIRMKKRIPNTTNPRPPCRMHDSIIHRI